jgi:hypothetical protein
LPFDLRERDFALNAVGGRSGAAEQVCDYFARPLVAMRGKLL